MSDVDLRVDWCNYEAAKYAVSCWHYSHTMPQGKLAKIGAWENGEFIGCVLFSNGASRFYGIPFGLEMLEVSELARVALNAHNCYVSNVVSKAIRLLKQKSPGLRLIVSFADPSVGHHGGIYQSGNWVYCGRGTSDARVRRYKLPDGRLWQWRSMAGFLNTNGYEATVKQAEKLGFTALETEPKHKYLYPLDRAMRRQIEPLRKPYPKRVPSVQGDTVGDQPAEAGSSPAARSELETQVDAR